MKTQKAQLNTFSVSFIIQKGKLKPSGKAPIFTRIIVNGKMAHFYTRLDIEADRWIPNAGRTLGLSREEKQTNDILDDIRSTVKDKYNALFSKGDIVTADLLRSSIIMKEHETQNMLLKFFDGFNEEYAKLVDKDTTYKTYTRYVLTRKKLSDYLNERYKVKDISLESIDHNFVKGFFNHLRTTEENGHNYHMKHIQRFRTVFNEAINSGLVKMAPFSKFKISFKATERDFLTQTELDRLTATELPTSKLREIRDLYLFSCFTGLAYCDVKKLKKSEVTLEEGQFWIHTFRGKTKVRVDVPLLDYPTKFIERYADKADTELLLKIISNDKINEHLEVIRSICGFDKDITFHISRHSNSDN